MTSTIFIPTTEKMIKIHLLENVFIIQTPLHFIVSMNLYNKMDIISKKNTFFIILENFDIKKLSSFLQIDPLYFKKIIYPSERHKNKFIRIWRTLTSYNKHRFINVKNVHIFNDSSFRVQKILNYIKEKENIILVEEGVAPYLPPNFKNDMLHTFLGHLLPQYKSCSNGFSGIYDCYMVVYPDLILEEFKSKKILKINKENYIYDSKLRIADNEVLILTSPMYNNLGNINLEKYKMYLMKLIDMLLIKNKKTYLKLHPLEKIELYQDLVQYFKNKIRIIPGFIPTNMIVFSKQSKITSLSFSSAFLYANNQKYIYKVPEDRFPYEEHKKIINRCGIKILDFH